MRWQEATNLESKLEREFQNLERKLNEQSRSFGEILKSKQNELEDVVHKKDVMTGDVRLIIHQRQNRTQKNSQIKKEKDRKRKQFYEASEEYKQL